MPYVARTRSLSGCGCRGHGMGASDAPVAPTIDTSPITDVTGLPPGTTTVPVATGNLLPFVALGGVLWYVFGRKRRSR